MSDLALLVHRSRSEIGLHWEKTVGREGRVEVGGFDFFLEII